MPALEILTFLAATMLFVLITAGAYVGVLGMAGALWLVRCERCDRLTAVSARTVASSCMWCRHEYVMHPLRAIHEHAPHAFHRG